jgi:hypothetical protein
MGRTGDHLPLMASMSKLTGDSLRRGPTRSPVCPPPAKTKHRASSDKRFGKQQRVKSQHVALITQSEPMAIYKLLVLVDAM